jgi:peptidoglycan/LPS O-acetylase OafA/YrhL
MRLDGLLMGVVLAALHVYRPALWARLQARSTWLLLGGLAFAALALWLFRHRTGLVANAVGWPLLSFGFGLLVLSATTARWAVPGTGWVAAISYSLYLSHKLVMHAVYEWLAPALPLHGLALFAVYAVAILVVGAALHYAVERPCLRLRDTLSPSVSPGPQARRATG